MPSWAQTTALTPESATRPRLEKIGDFGRNLGPIKVKPAQRICDNLRALRRTEPSVHDDAVLAIDPAQAANALHLTGHGLLSHRDPQILRQRLEAPQASTVSNGFRHEEWTYLPKLSMLENPYGVEELGKTPANAGERNDQRSLSDDPRAGEVTGRVKWNSAPSPSVLSTHVATVRVHELLDDGQTKPGPAVVARRRGVDLIEGVEDPIAMLGGEPGALVSDRQLDRPGEPFPKEVLLARATQRSEHRFHPDGAWSVLKLDPIREQVHQHLLDPSRVRTHSRQPLRSFHLDSMSARFAMNSTPRTARAMSPSTSAGFISSGSSPTSIRERSRIWLMRA